MTIKDIIFILGRPGEPGNTGAVCRAMKNMGFNKLRIAAPEYDNYKGTKGTDDFLKKLLDRAIHASDIWEDAEFYDTLKEALADCSIIIGTSRRRGRKRKSVSMTPKELAGFLKSKQGKAGIVFGNERTGLNQNELELCNIASHIPVFPEFPSINLSHAVQIYSYELYQSLAEGSVRPAPGTWVPLNNAEIELQVKTICDFLRSIGFYKYPGRADQERFLCDLIARAGLNLNESRYLCNIIAKTAVLEGEK